MKIETALAMDDQQLADLFENDPATTRHEFQQRQAAGELLIGSVGCEGFDPVNGCPGHPKTSLEKYGYGTPTYDVSQ